MRTPFFSIGLVLLFWAALNWASLHIPWQTDLSGEGRFTLDSLTQARLHKLDQPVTITVLAGPEMPYQFARRKERLQRLLDLFHERSGGKVLYQFRDPEAPDAQGRPLAQAFGLKPVVFRLRKEDALQEQKGYFGMALRQGKRQEVVRYIDPKQSLEFVLVEALARLRPDALARVAWLTGYGSLKPKEAQEWVQSLPASMSLQAWPWARLGQLPERIGTVLIAQPTDSLPAPAFEALDAFLRRGGHCLIAASPADPRFQARRIEYRRTGLSSWLREKGIRLSPHVIVDRNCGRVAVRFREAGGSVKRRIPFPYYPAFEAFAEHPINRPLKRVLLPYAVQVGVYPSLPEAVDGQMLMVSSEQSGRRTLPTRLAWERQWKAADFESENLPAALALSGPLTESGATNRLVLVGSGTFFRDGERPLPPDNLRLASGALEWLTAEASLTALQNKVARQASLPPLKGDLRQAIKWSLWLGPVLVLAVGLATGAALRRRRLRREKARLLRGAA